MEHGDDYQDEIYADYHQDDSDVRQILADMILDKGGNDYHHHEPGITKQGIAQSGTFPSLALAF